MRHSHTILPAWDRWVVVAVGGSLAVHLILFLLLDLAIRYSLFSPEHLPQWLRPLTRPLPAVKVPTMTVEAQQTPPLIFVQVDPSRASEPPPDTPFYSSASTRAANETIKFESDKPNIEGKQTEMVKTETTPREKAFPLQPTPAPPPEPERKTQAPPEPKAAPKPGDLALARPAESSKTGDDLKKRLGQPEPPARPRPRTIEEAKRMLNPSLAGEAMKQEGGVKRRAAIQLDVKGTPFGRYDEAFIRAVQNRWYDLIDERRFAAAAAGKVVVAFRLNYDGRITHARIEETNVDLILTHICQKAREDPSPYEPWPADMRRMVGANYRELRFSFIYY
jgi:hypothetical protein